MKYLLFDISLAGHHSEFIDHLIKFLAEDVDSSDEYHFILHTEFKMQFPEIVKVTDGKSKFDIHYVSEKEWIDARKGNLIRQSFAHLKLLNSYANKYKVDRVILLHINIFQLALGFLRTRYEISGILFSQFTRQDIKDNLLEKLRYCRRYVQTYLLTRNNKITCIYILNDKESCAKLNRVFGSGIFRFLPDPVAELSVSKYVDIRHSYSIPKENIVFLHFGSLSERKGTIDILQSLIDLKHNNLNAITILLVGKTDNEGTAIKILNFIEQIRLNKKDVQIVFDDKFVDIDLKNCLFHQCDVVLIPYKNVEASSGILGHAIAAKKPVVGPSKGLLGDLIEKHGLGITYTGNFDAAILFKVKDWTQYRISSAGLNNDPFEFAKIVLGKP